VKKKSGGYFKVSLKARAVKPKPAAVAVKAKARSLDGLYWHAEDLDE
jgi:hypothetical protein